MLEDQARALGGLGDAAYARGLMRTAHDNFRRCVKLCDEHGFGRIAAAYLGMAAFTRMYFDNLEDVKTSALEAIEAAQRVGHRRAEMNARLGICETLLLTSENELVEEHAERGLALARVLGARSLGDSDANVPGARRAQNVSVQSDRTRNARLLD